MIALVGVNNLFYKILMMTLTLIPSDLLTFQSKEMHMTNSEYLLEIAILSTVLFSHHSNNEEEFFNDLELYEEWFSHPYHKIIIKAINHHKAKGEPTYEEFIADSLAKRGQLDHNLWLAIISASPFSRVQFEKYLEVMKEPNKSLIEGI